MSRHNASSKKLLPPPDRALDRRLEQHFRHAEWSEAMEILKGFPESDLNDFQVSLKMDLYTLLNNYKAADHLFNTYSTMPPRHPHYFLALARRNYKLPDSIGAIGIEAAYNQAQVTNSDLEISENQYYLVQVGRFYLLSLVNRGQIETAKETFNKLINLEIVKSDPLLRARLLATGLKLFRCTHDFTNYKTYTHEVIQLFRQLKIYREMRDPLLDEASLYTLCGAFAKSQESITEAKTILRSAPQPDHTPYIVETEAAMLLYSGKLDEAAEKYHEALSLAKIAGISLTYFAVPYSYCRFLQLSTSNVTSAHEWFLQEILSLTSSNEVDHALINAYSAIVSVHYGRFNETQFIAGLKTEDYLLYFRLLAYLVEFGKGIGQMNSVYLDQLINTSGVDYKSVLRWDIHDLRRTYNFVLSNQGKPYIQTKNRINCYALSGCSVTANGQSIKLGSGIGSIVFASLLILKDKYSLKSLIQLLGLNQRDARTMRSGINKINQRFQKYLMVNFDLILVNNKQVYLNPEFEFVLDAEKSSQIIPDALDIDPQYIFAGFEGCIFDDYRESIRDQVISLMISELLNVKDNHPLLPKLLNRTVRSYSDDHDLITAMLSVAKRFFPSEALSLEAKLRELS